MQTVSAAHSPRTVLFASAEGAVPLPSECVRAGTVVVHVEGRVALNAALQSSDRLDLLVISEQLLGSAPAEFLCSLRQTRANTALILYSSSAENVMRLHVRNPRTSTVFNKVGSRDLLAIQVDEVLSAC